MNNVIRKFLEWTAHTVGAASAANSACTLKGHCDIEAPTVIAAEAAPTQDFRLFMKHPGYKDFQFC